MAIKAESKKVSPRSVLDFFGISPRIDFHKEGGGSSKKSYVSFEDEEKSTWHGTEGKDFPEYDEEKKKLEARRREREAAAKRERAAASKNPPKPDLIDQFVGKIQLLSLKALLEKATDPEDGYYACKQKHVERIVKICSKDAVRARTIAKHYDEVLRRCTEGSLTRADRSVRIMKVCFVLHAVLRSGTAAAYRNVFGSFPDIFDLPQNALPKSIPSSCVEARMAIAYASYLDVRLRLRQQQGAAAAAEEPRRGVVTLRELFEKGMACRFFRKRDFSTIFARDTVQLFQFQIISDLLAHVEGARAELSAEREDQLMEKREAQLVAWSHRMQAANHMSDAEYGRLSEVKRAVESRQMSAKQEEARQEELAVANAPASQPLPDLLSF